MENLKEKILNLFYYNHFKVKDISKSTEVSSAYVTKVIQGDTRYTLEKKLRKENSKDKRKLYQRNFIKKKRENKRIEDNYDFVQSQHKQASRELSQKQKLSDEDYRKWNQSAYKYNSSKHRYEFDDNLGCSYDVPKYIKER